MGISTQAIISNDEILDFIPQRSPIVMVSEFLGIEDNVSMTALTITEDNIFCECGALSDCGVIEHIAQSAAMRMGYIYKSAGRDVPLGYIGSVNKFKIFALPKISERITTEIRIEQEFMNISLISAVVRLGEQIVAECSMKIFLQE